MATTLRKVIDARNPIASQLRRQSRAAYQCSLQWRRRYHVPPTTGSIGVPDFAFAFDIDGVLVRSSAPLPGASKALQYLQKERIPFILLTNGGGKSEEERVAYLSEKLDVELDTSLIVQSHTPFAEMKHLHDKTVLVVGGDYDKCQLVAQKYGFKYVVTPGDLVVAYPDIWPFSKVFLDYYKNFAKPLPKPITSPSNPESAGDGNRLKIDAVFVYNDPRDWGLDAAVMLDTMLSKQGYLGTLSSKNGDVTLPNNGYQQDGQPLLYYSNPDLWWATSYHISRLGQGGFKGAFDGLWSAVTGGARLEQTVIGKPSQETYEFAETRLRRHRKALFRHIGLNDPLRQVYMIGDNPESDIRGANNYQSPHGSKWTSILLRTGVYQDGTEPSCKPDVIKDNVLQAVEWAVEDAKKR
ncbi:hypothetical protein HII31_01843 [Pseudocercospora fuligena]|uniref:HAD-superfamily hydrolase n=1 Tax=Pseudocercospora fuligena TaxID=685502 RepID=A0A8H6VS78_9PEZI|nr:hypothetical protein HII31_01843 [Pseudocercospora fuligena]